jgi:hypothetical protein
MALKFTQFWVLSVAGGEAVNRITPQGVSNPVDRLIGVGLRHPS